MRYSIVIFSIYALIITVNAQYKTPNCTAQHTNPKLNITKKTLLVFAIGYNATDTDKAKIAYVVRQTACWIPKHDNIYSGTYFHPYGILVDDKYDQQNTLDKITQYSEIPDPVSCDKFGEGLKKLKNNNEVKKYESIKIIAHARTINENCDYALKWKNANLSSKFDFFIIRFDDKKDDAYISLNYKDVNSINVNDTSPPEPLKNVTGTFMNYVIGVDKPPKVATSPAPKENSINWGLIIGVLVGIGVSVGIGVLLCWHQKWLCFKKKKERKNKSRSKRASPNSPRKGPPIPIPTSPSSTPKCAPASTPTPAKQPNTAAPEPTPVKAAAPAVASSTKSRSSGVAPQSDGRSNRTMSARSIGRPDTEGRDDLGDENEDY